MQRSLGNATVPLETNFERGTSSHKTFIIGRTSARLEFAKIGNHWVVNGSQINGKKGIPAWGAEGSAAICIARAESSESFLHAAVPRRLSILLCKAPKTFPRTFSRMPAECAWLGHRANYALEKVESLTLASCWHVP